MIVTEGERRFRVERKFDDGRILLRSENGLLYWMTRMSELEMLRDLGALSIEQEGE